MNFRTSLLLASSLGLSSLYAQKDAKVQVSRPQIQERPAGSSGFFNSPVLKFGSGRGEPGGPGIPVGNLSYTHLFSSDFDTFDGDVSVDEFSLITPLASIKVGGAYVIPMLTYRSTQFDTDATTLLTEDTLHQIRVPIAVLYEPTDRWIVGGMVMPAFAGDLGNSDNFSISGALGAGYEYSSELSIFGGVYYFNGYDESYAIPGLGFTWNPNDQWQVYFLGPVAGVSYNVNDRWTVSLTGQYISPTWNVEADELGPDRDITVKGMRVGLKTEHHLGKYAWGYATVGYSFLREMEIEDLDSNELQQDDIDAGLFLETGLTIRF